MGGIFSATLLCEFNNFFFLECIQGVVAILYDLVHAKPKVVIIIQIVLTLFP